jgi:hypothetical protein
VICLQRVTVLKRGAVLSTPTLVSTVTSRSRGRALVWPGLAAGIAASGRVKDGSMIDRRDLELARFLF